jgi:alpha-1,3/alpha-1,6-mannosyltransferase
MKGRGYKPEVVYPSIDEKAFLKNKDFKETIQGLLGREVDATRTILMVSLNRYERKKNIPLALESFAYYMKQEGRDRNLDPVLVIAGGYDPRLEENVQVHNDLKSRAEALGLADHVVFLRSISND